MSKLCVFVLILLAASCGGSSNESDVKNPAPPTDIKLPSPPLSLDALLTDKDYWGEDTAYKTFTTAGKNRASLISFSSKSGLCAVVNSGPTNVLELQSENTCWNEQADVINTTQYSENSLVKGIAHAEDGRFAVAELIDQPLQAPGSFKPYHLEISVYSADGSLNSREILYDPPTTDELLFYEIFDGWEGGNIATSAFENIEIGGQPVLLESAKIQLEWRNNELYLLAYTYGIKIYKLSETLQTEWATQVMPANDWLWVALLGHNTKFTISDNGEIFIATEVRRANIAAYEQHFGRELGEGSNIFRDIAVIVVDAQGQIDREFLLGSIDASEYIGGLKIVDNKLWLALNSVREKPQKPSNKRNWDILLLSTSPANGTVSDTYIIDHDEEDLANGLSLMPNNNLLIFGQTGFVQADTNSVVSNGSGMLLELNLQGELLRKKILQGPRSVSINDAFALDDDRIGFAGVFNAPITHTCDNDPQRTQCFEHGVIGVSTLQTAN